MSFWLWVLLLLQRNAQASVRSDFVGFRYYDRSDCSNISESANRYFRYGVCFRDDVIGKFVTYEPPNTKKIYNDTICEVHDKDEILTVGECKRQMTYLGRVDQNTASLEKVSKIIMKHEKEYIFGPNPPGPIENCTVKNASKIYDYFALLNSFCDLDQRIACYGHDHFFIEEYNGNGGCENQPYNVSTYRQTDSLSYCNKTEGVYSGFAGVDEVVIGCSREVLLGGMQELGIPLDETPFQTGPPAGPPEPEPCQTMLWEGETTPGNPGVFFTGPAPTLEDWKKKFTFEIYLEMPANFNDFLTGKQGILGGDCGVAKGFPWAHFGNDGFAMEPCGGPQHGQGRLSLDLFEPSKRYTITVEKHLVDEVQSTCFLTILWSGNKSHIITTRHWAYINATWGGIPTIAGSTNYTNGAFTGKLFSVALNRTGDLCAEYEAAMVSGASRYNVSFNASFASVLYHLMSSADQRVFDEQFRGAIANELSIPRTDVSIAGHRAGSTIVQGSVKVNTQARADAFRNKIVTSPGSIFSPTHGMSTGYGVPVVTARVAQVNTTSPGTTDEGNSSGDESNERGSSVYAAVGGAVGGLLVVALVAKLYVMRSRTAKVSPQKASSQDNGKSPA